MSQPTLTVIAFPGNNCETETARAATRAGFETNVIRWNQVDLVGNSDAYILPGGFSFEDRGRSGAIASREPIFDALREEAKKGKVILGICNGAQMIVESGLIPVAGNPLALSLADNVRRDETGHVIGTGYYNAWVNLKPTDKTCAFTGKALEVNNVPIAHGEGRFTTTDPNVEKALSEDEYVAFRYSDEKGEVSTQYPVTPNGALHAVAAITNQEGTIMAMMPHPERFFEEFEGDTILQSMHEWCSENKSPASVEIGDFSVLDQPEIGTYNQDTSKLYIEKKLIITDNEQFSVEQVAKALGGDETTLNKTTLFEVECEGISADDVINTGLLLNDNKEQVQPNVFDHANKYAVTFNDDDLAELLSAKLTAIFGKPAHVKRSICWNFGDTDQKSIEKVLQNRLLSNPNGSRIEKV